MNGLEINRSNYGDRENDKHGSEKITSPVNRHSNSHMKTGDIWHTARNDFGLIAFPFVLLIVLLAVTSPRVASSSSQQSSTPYTEPRWMGKMRAQQAGQGGSNPGANAVNFNNVNVSNEAGPQ